MAIEELAYDGRNELVCDTTKGAQQQQRSYDANVDLCADIFFFAGLRTLDKRL